MENNNTEILGQENTPKFTVYIGEKNEKIIYNKKYPNNRTMTTKYKLITFLPKSLLMQFRRAANIYFLAVTILTFGSFSPINPASMIGTFVFVLTCTMIKEALEDYKRYKQDEINNNRIVKKLVEGQWTDIKCWTLMPGDIIKVSKDEEFPADILLLKSSKENGYAYIETKSLDGESNLKEKACFEYFNKMNNEEISEIKGYIECDLPNDNLNVWNGKLFIYNNGEEEEEGGLEFYCNISNIILKGCVLKNTDYISGIVVYSGKNTKIMKNAKNVRGKLSKVMNEMNTLLYSVFIFEITLCIICGYLCLKFEDENTSTYTYIFYNQKKKNKFLRYLTNTMTYFVSYSNMIPISLYVVLEMIKFIQGLLVYYDNDIYDSSIDKPANFRSTDLVEELGQVEFLFTDKTGTLTQNSMVLKKLYVNGKVFGNNRECQNPNEKFSINGDMRIYKKLKNSNNEDDMNELINFENLLYLLCLCHDVFPEEKNNIINYQGSSPDEISLVKGAAQLGYVFKSKELDTYLIEDEIHNSIKKFKLEAMLPFDSNRKRMSVIVYNLETLEYEILTKGADSSMLEIINFKPGEREEIIRINNILSKEGLRILMMGKKIIKKNEAIKYIKKLKEFGNKSGEDLAIIFDELEINLEFVGTSAIEDKLQEGVPETICSLLSCNIRIWVLTGDKKETAIVISKSCNLINENMEIQELVEDGIPTEIKMTKLQTKYNIEDNKESIKTDLNEISKKIKIKGKDLSIVIDGITLEGIFADERLSLIFFNISVAAKSVICCRVNPKQKSKVVRLIKTYGKWVTLAIGDGSNDVPMIMEAHIGIGIQGKEGTQAVRSADCSIGQFRFLQKLILIYGRVGYIKISKFICYYFYKNILLIFSDIIFAFLNGFSGQLFYADYLTTMYNAIFTSWCCIFVFSFEKDVDLNIVKNYPILYEAGQKNCFFNLPYFWTYIIYAIIHGFLSFFIPQMFLKDSEINNGITFNHWQKSTVSFSLLIHVVSYKLMIISDFWNWINITATVVSILFYYAIVFGLCNDFFAFKLQNEVAGVMVYLFKSYKFWILITVGPILILSIDISMKFVEYNSFPNPTDYIKQHLKDPSFISHLKNDENIHNNYNSGEAKKYEKEIKKLLKIAREKKNNKKVKNE